jgi:hypothetical protein
MKYTIVPAQVTTVEDRIAGNLSMNQLLLLIAPVFLSTVLYVILPPNLHFALYKVGFMLALLILCCLSAIRIKGKILILWIITISRYNLRPKYYLYNKNSLSGREQYLNATSFIEEVTKDDAHVRAERLPRLATADKVLVEQLMDNPASNLSFISKKGRLNVVFTEIKD